MQISKFQNFDFDFFFLLLFNSEVQGNLLRILSTVRVRLDLWFNFVRRPWTQKHKRRFEVMKSQKVALIMILLQFGNIFFFLENVVYRGCNLEIPFLLMVLLTMLFNELLSWKTLFKSFYQHKKASIVLREITKVSLVGVESLLLFEVRQSLIWYAGSIGQLSHWTSVWCSKYYFLS